MTVHSPPLWLQNGSYSADEDRQIIRSLVLRPGVRLWSPNLLGEFAVTQKSTPSMFLNVSGGYAYVAGAGTSGTYAVYNDASDTVSLSPSSTSLPRIDLVVLRIYDQTVSGVVNSAVLEVVTGTAASSPVVPAVPALSIPLAQIAVAANASAITNANITDLRVPAGSTNGVTPVLNSAARAGLTFAGSLIYRIDTGDLEVWSGTAWIPFSGALDSGYLTTGITAAAGWSISAQSYRRLGNQIRARVTFARTSSNISVPADGDIVTQQVCTFPAGYRVTETQHGTWSPGAVGRACAMHMDTTGALWMSWVSPSGSITTGEQFSIAGDFWND